MESLVLNKLLIVLLLLFTSFSYAAELPELTHGLSAIKAKPLAPSLKFTNLDEDIVDIQLLKGKVIVVNFWATWCPPCRREMSSLEHLYLATKDHGVEILAVNIGEDIDTVFSFLGEVEPTPTYPILFDYDAKSMGDWAVKGLPTTYVVNKQGQVVYRAIGGREFDHPDIIRKVLELTQ